MNDTPIEDPPEVLVARLVELMQLEQIEIDLYRGAQALEKWPRVFGGQVIAQALKAAASTVAPDRAPHSLHGYFMRPGSSEIPILYQVHRDRDGASFSSRRVVAIQNGKPILNLAASFHVAETGLEHQFAMPEAPPPETLQSEIEIALKNIEAVPETRRRFVLRRRPLEFRPATPQSSLFNQDSIVKQMFWLRVTAPLPNDPLLHRVLLAYASDVKLLSSSFRAHGYNWRNLHEMNEASLDHAVWFHDDFRIDDWLLCVQDSPWTGGGRGLSRALYYRRDGRLAAAATQEGLIRVRRP